MGVWVGPEEGLHGFGEEKNLTPAGIRTPDRRYADMRQFIKIL